MEKSLYYDNGTLNPVCFSYRYKLRVFLVVYGILCRKTCSPLEQAATGICDGDGVLAALSSTKALASPEPLSGRELLGYRQLLVKNESNVHPTGSAATHGDGPSEHRK